MKKQYYNNRKTLRTIAWFNWATVICFVVALLLLILPIGQRSFIAPMGLILASAPPFIQLAGGIYAERRGIKSSQDLRDLRDKLVILSRKDEDEDKWR